MARPPLLLICDDDPTIHLAIKHALKGKFDFRSARDTDEARLILKTFRADLLLLDIQMRTPNEGLEAIPVFRDLDPEMAIIMSSGRTDFDAVRESMRLGAVDYAPKDLDPDGVLHVLMRALERRSLLRRREQQSFEVAAQQRRHVLIGESDSIQSLKRIVERVRTSAANVLISGETGTGKEVVARQLRGTLPDGTLAPFVAVDSSTIQSSVAESLLFGHEKGAFTGAENMARGIFEEADGGVVYFDEIGNMPLGIQAKLLRVIQEREFTRLGSSRVIRSEFRVVCASNRDLDEMSRKGEFKDDLLQRLNVLPIHIPPLRERPSDIPLLVDHFLHAQPRSLRLTQAAMELLQAYSWPGNVRELGNVIAYVAAMCDGSEVDVADLPPKFRDGCRPAAAPSLDGTFYERMAALERKLLSDEYVRWGRNVSRMAIQLGMDRSHLHSKLKEHDIHPPRRDG